MKRKELKYKDSWQYKKVKEIGYKTKITKTKVIIYFPDGGEYANFTLKKDDNFYFIYNYGELINEELEFYDTYDESVTSCLYYFLTRY